MKKKEEITTLPFDSMPDSALARKRALKESGIFPFSDSTLWRMCEANQFPTPIKVSASITAWRVGEIRDWLEDPANYHTDDNAARLLSDEKEKQGGKDD